MIHRSLNTAAELALALPSLDDALRTVNEVLALSLTFGAITLTLGAVLAAAVVLLLAILVSRMLRRALAHYAERYTASEAALYAVGRVAHYTVLALGVLWALSVAGVPIARFGIFLGALGVGLGFGLQAIFANFISGLVLLFDRSLKVGDFIELPDGRHGQVRDIHIRATRIRTNDNIDIMVPNANLITGDVVNFTWADEKRRLHVPFRVPLDADKERVRTAALEAAAAVPHTRRDAEHPPQVWLMAFGEYALEFTLVVWLLPSAARRYRAVIAAYNWALHDSLARHGLVVPVPQRDVRLGPWTESPHRPAADPDQPA